MSRKIFISLSCVAVSLIVCSILFWSGHSKALNPFHATCNNCHNLHTTPTQDMADTATSEALCLGCHGPAGIATKKAEVHTNKASSTKAPFNMSCMDCHNPHDNMENRFAGTNLFQVGRDVNLDGTAARIATPNSGDRWVVFESRGTDAGGPKRYSFADGDDDGDGYYDGVCETCHTDTDNHQNISSASDHTHFVGLDCTQCHPHADSFWGSGGGCLGCHGSIADKGDGPPTRRAIAGEFSMASHHVKGGSATDDDCGVCHEEAIDSGTHQNNQVDLRDPDTGGVISFTQFSRNTGSASLESWVTNVQNNFCLKCHDGDGATATNFSGNPLRPFSASSGDVPNVAAQFNPSNASHHAVLGTVGNPYCNGTTMVAPWGSNSIISCFDCHGTSGHGSANQRMLRVSMDFDGVIAAGAAADIGAIPATFRDNVETFCTMCHKSTTYVSSNDPEADGSIFEFHGAAQNQHGASGGNELGCMGCHAGIVDFGAGLASGGNGAAPGNIHGTNFTWGGGTFSAGVTTEHFMLGGWISGWYTFTNRGSPYGGCGGGDCNHKGRSNSEGKSYTR